MFSFYTVTCKDYTYPDAHTNDGTYLDNGDVVIFVTGHGGIIRNYEFTSVH